ncbi:MAG: peptidoglycan-binding protein, partial [Clostridia bacterium]|nr:peptidoglycan-binding protein [Clostridia bacterium]
ADGRVDYPTWVALASAANRIRRQNRPPMAVPLYGSDEPDAGVETPCDAAFGAQIMCRSLARRFANIPAPALTGRWDEPTKQDIREIQHICGLPVTGRMDADTWNAMTQAYAEFCRGTASPH